MRRLIKFLLFWAILAPGLATGLQAADVSFDLTGPKVDVHVKRGEVTLPIGSVPNLLPGDRLWIHPDLPESQSTHYVLIVAFLRGATNPPPPEWFTRVETWNREVRSEGVFVVVPAEAQQALLFLAPETGGDFSTLRAAVRGRPGAFVRATQDLQSASWDRMRLESYLAEVKITSQTDAKLLKTRAEMAARSLGIRVDQQCFDKPTDQQAPCLTAHTENVVLDDANAGTLVDQWTTGSTRDLMNQISYSPMGGAGAFSPYIGAIVDTARILSSLHTAHFQYIPALALPTTDTLNLRLSVPPSFRDPKSVVVVALPPVGPARMPTLRPVNPAETYCGQKPGLVLAAEGAPLVFSTQMARDLTLHIDSKSGVKDLKIKADPSQGGLVLDRPAPSLPEEESSGVVRGMWGFDSWEGPRFHFHSAQPGKWTLAPGDQSALVVGREDLLHLEDANSVCVDRIEAQVGDANPIKVTWKSSKPEVLEVSVPMKEAAPGAVSLSVFQFGLEKPDKLSMHSYAEAASLDRLTLSAGDTQAVLKGTRLDEVAKAALGEIVWTPATLSRVQDFDQLSLTASASTAGLEPGKHHVATVQLRDGRELKVPVTVDAPRPQLTLLSKGVQEDASAAPSPVHLGSADDLPLAGRLVFFLRSNVPAKFPRTQKIEVAAEDGSFRTLLSLADGSLMLEDARIALGVVDPLARFGSSAFGPLRLRAISAEGVEGDWLPLGTLVRLPSFKELRCPHALAKPCALSGANLFLADSIASTPEFDNAAEVPADFTGTQLSVPHPVNGLLYLKLRDDPGTVQTLTLPITTAAPSAAVPLPQSAPAVATPPPTPAAGENPAPVLPATANPGK
jgi:hypothetical protein